MKFNNQGIVLSSTNTNFYQLTCYCIYSLNCDQLFVLHFPLFKQGHIGKRKLHTVSFGKLSIYWIKCQKPFLPW